MPTRILSTVSKTKSSVFVTVAEVGKGVEYKGAITIRWGESVLDSVILNYKMAFPINLIEAKDMKPFDFNDFARRTNIEFSMDGKPFPLDLHEKRFVVELCSNLALNLSENPLARLLDVIKKDNPHYGAWASVISGRHCNVDLNHPTMCGLLRKAGEMKERDYASSEMRLYVETLARVNIPNII
jgi:hypothetical protein